MTLSELKQHAPSLRMEAQQHAMNYASNIRKARYYEKVGGETEARWARINAETHLTLYRMATNALNELFPPKDLLKIMS